MARRATTPAFSIDLDRARSFWHARQGFGGSDDPVESVRRTGWARTLGGIDVYLAIRARCPGATRASIEGAVAAGDLRVVPAVRGCIYLVPGDQAAEALALAADLSRPRTEREREKAGIAASEVDDLAAAVEAALKKGPLDTHAIRKALPDGSVRSLGAAGKKVGLSSPLPVALRELEFRGRIERTPVDHRLDHERYVWRLVPKSKIRRVRGSEADRLAAIVRRFLETFGPATVEEASDWIGVAKGRIREALAGLPVLPVEIEGHAACAHVLEEDREPLAAAGPTPPVPVFLPFGDNHIVTHGGPGALTDPVHHGMKVERWGSARATTLGAARHIDHRPLILGGELRGFWEFDPDRGAVAFGLLGRAPRGTAGPLEEAARELGAFIASDLGHGRSFSLDTDESIRARLETIRRI